MTHTVCILTSGKGTRMGEYCKYLNKALLPLGKKAAISHIIECFPVESTFVVTLGHLGDQVRNYLLIAHSDRKFEFVHVDRYEGTGSGPGYSLSCAKHLLQRPFYYISCDTLWDNELDLSLDETWLGVAKVSPAQSINYCNFRIEDGKVVEVRDKQRVEGQEYQAYVGMAYIKDYAIFWRAMSEKDLVLGEQQFSNGLRLLIESKPPLALEINWTDIGDEVKYRHALDKYESYDFSKPDEALYFINCKVIKFFHDEKAASNRIAKAELNPDVFPRITDYAPQWYAYEFVDGKTLYQESTPVLFLKALNWLQNNLWKPADVSSEQMKQTCRKFYFEKTMERIQAYNKKYDSKDTMTIVNGQLVPDTKTLLEKVPWEKLFSGIPSYMHGDLHFDHIVYDGELDRFILLDWRHDFAGQVEFGDLYYDLAKMFGGLILNYDYIKLNLFSYYETDDGIFVDFAQRYSAKEYQQLFGQWLTENNYDIGKIRILVALIYLNMAPLHHYPFDKMLYSFGRLLLSKELA